jgi:hypothetical protein
MRRRAQTRREILPRVRYAGPPREALHELWREAGSRSEILSGVWNQGSLK